MPTYSYECKSCGEGFDIEASIADKKRGLQVSCPWCGSAEAEQILGGFTVLTPKASGGCCSPSSGCCGPAPKRSQR